MADSNDQKDKARPTLTLNKTSNASKTGDSPPLRPSGQGGSKSFTVAVVKKPGTRQKASASQTSEAAPSTQTEKRDSQGRVLTDSEREKRLKVLAAYDLEKTMPKEAPKSILEDHPEEEDEDIATEETVETPAEPESPAVPAEPEAVQKEAKTGKHHAAKPSPKDEDDENESAKNVKRPHKASPKGGRQTTDKWNQSRLKAQALLGDDSERTHSMASMRRRHEKQLKQQQVASAGPAEKFSRVIQLPEIITVQELSNRMAERLADVTRELMKLGMVVTAQQTVDADTAELVAEALGHKVNRVADADVENILIEEDDDPKNLTGRPPIVTIMGHVDHGKTSLLDAIRSTDVAASEAGGITQHIGAYQITTKAGQKISFIDTPGHEAFTSMRSRGAKITDIVVLVVAADDGVMPQTIEAINHAKAAQVPIIVAVNKIDKPDADSANIRNELLHHDLVPESLGGDIIVVDVSAKTGQNLDELSESILLQAEMLELKANANRRATGYVLESKIDKGKGVVTTLLIERGTLALGNIVVAGSTFGKIRAMNNDKGDAMVKALPAMPVEVLGLNDPPTAGDRFSVVQNEKQARDICDFRMRKERDVRSLARKPASLDELFARISPHNKNKELPVIIKADVHGSTEAILASLEKIATEEISIKAIHTGVGGITESDISLAQASNAIVLGFNVRSNPQAKELAREEEVDIRYYSIIYDLIDDMKRVMGGMLSPIIKENYLGSAEIRQVYNISKVGRIAGCFVVDGIIKKGAKVRLLRDNVVIHEGMLKTLKRFKEDVKEVKENFECGLALESYQDIKEKDVVEAFELIEEKQVLS